MQKFEDTKAGKLIFDRWRGKDMETYFREKNKAFIEKLKKEVGMK